MMGADCAGPDEFKPGEPVEIPITGELDLHSFSPKDLKELLPAYLEACRDKRILEVRIVHGRGRGQLRNSVHALLSRLPYVTSFSIATGYYGGWGATIVHLAPLPSSGRPA